VATQYYLKLGGEEFLRKFYVGQKPTFSRNERQITDWLLRGTYPIVIGGDFAVTIGVGAVEALQRRALELGLADLAVLVEVGGS